MHDIGKIAIPDAILCKPGKLTRDEFAAMQTHAELGATLLAGSQSPVLRMAHEIALGHHERWDGSGYPSGLRGTEIPEAARIVAIVDVYDALEPRPRLSPRDAGIGSSEDSAGRAEARISTRELLDVFMSLLPEMRAIAETVTDAAEEETDFMQFNYPSSICADTHARRFLTNACAHRAYRTPPSGEPAPTQRPCPVWDCRARAISQERRSGLQTPYRPHRRPPR